MDTRRNPPAETLRRVRTLAAAALALLWLAACGQRGPLYLPDDEARTPATAPETTAAPEEEAEDDGAGR